MYEDRDNELIFSLDHDMSPPNEDHGEDGVPGRPVGGCFAAGPAIAGRPPCATLGLSRSEEEGTYMCGATRTWSADSWGLATGKAGGLPFPVPFPKVKRRASSAPPAASSSSLEIIERVPVQLRPRSTSPSSGLRLEMDGHDPGAVTSAFEAGKAEPSPLSAAAVRLEPAPAVFNVPVFPVHDDSIESTTRKGMRRMRKSSAHGLCYLDGIRDPGF